MVARAYWATEKHATYIDGEILDVTKNSHVDASYARYYPAYMCRGKVMGMATMANKMTLFVTFVDRAERFVRWK